LGQPGRECWSEIWPIIGPEIDGVMAGGDATFHEDALVPIFRNGRIEEVYWTYGYSPVFEEDGSIAGVLVVVTETTSRVVALRRLRTAQLLSEALGLATDHEHVAHALVRSLGSAPEDVPWSLVYRSQGTHSSRSERAGARDVDGSPLEAISVAIPSRRTGESRQICAGDMRQHF
jgi:PAS fold